MITDILNAVGVQHRRGRFPSPPAETYTVYFDNISGEGADPIPVTKGESLPGIQHHDITVEVYEPKPDDTVEASIEAELTARGLSWSKQDRYWLQDVQRYQVIYEFSYTTKTP